MKIQVRTRIFPTDLKSSEFPLRRDLKIGVSALKDKICFFPLIKMLISSIGRVFLFMSCALAAKPLEHEVCGASCYYSLLKIKYANENKTQVTACTNPLRVTSTYYCMGIHCSDADVEPGIKWWAGTCKQSKKLVNLDRYHATLGNVTDAFLASLPTVNLKEKDIIDGPAVPSAENWLVVHRSVSTYDQMRHYHNSVR